MAEEDTPHGEDNKQVPEAPETDWKAEARKWESRAKENLASAKSNEAAAQRLAEIEESQKTAEQKQAEELAKAQATIAELTTARVRAEVAAAKGVPAALLTGSTQEELEAAADALIAFKGDRAKGPVIPTQGTTPDKPAPESADDWIRGLVGR